jgi:two-component system, sensor histidine kinase and response regulator
MDVATTDGGAAALDTMTKAKEQGQPFDVAVIDGSLSGMSGFDLAAEIEQDANLADCAVILLTTLLTKGSVPEPKQGRMLHRIPKPPKLHDLLTSLNNLRSGQGGTEISPDPNLTDPLEQSQVKRRILVADDNPVNRILAVHMLQKRGQTVVAVEDGNAVLNCLEKNDFDCILMDVEMPRKNGLEATKTIREKEEGTGRHIPIIAMTAHAMKGDQAAFLRAGMDGYASKPVDWDHLFETIKALT